MRRDEPKVAAITDPAEVSEPMEPAQDVRVPGQGFGQSGISVQPSDAVEGER